MAFWKRRKKDSAQFTIVLQLDFDFKRFDVLFLKSCLCYLRLGTGECCCKLITSNIATFNWSKCIGTQYFRVRCLSLLWRKIEFDTLLIFACLLGKLDNSVERIHYDDTVFWPRSRIASETELEMIIFFNPQWRCGKCWQDFLVATHTERFCSAHTHTYFLHI